jgi:hypothetical protein
MVAIKSISNDTYHMRHGTLLYMLIGVLAGCSTAPKQTVAVEAPPPAPVIETVAPAPVDPALTCHDPFVEAEISDDSDLIKAWHDMYHLIIDDIRYQCAPEGCDLDLLPEAQALDLLRYRHKQSALFKE